MFFSCLFGGWEKTPDGCNMLPKYNDDLKKDFDIVKMPSKTYFYNMEKKSIKGFADGMEALLQAVYLILISKRFRHEIYSFNYGVETDELTGCPEDVIYPRIEQIFTDALMQDDRINSVSDFEFKKEKDSLNVSFIVNSNIGSFKMDKSIG